MLSESLKATEAECAEGRTAPRVSLADIEANIIHEYYINGGEAVRAIRWVDDSTLVRVHETLASLDLLTICLLVTKNGFTVVGKSAPASAENFDAELGRKLAYEDAVLQLWSLMGYALREKLHQGD